MSDNPLDRLLAKLDGLDAGQRQLEAGQRQLEAGQKQLRMDLMGRMERLADDIGRIRDDIGVNMGRAKRAIEAADHTREELRSLGSEIAAIWRKVCPARTSGCIRPRWSAAEGWRLGRGLLIVLPCRPTPTTS